MVGPNTSSVALEYVMRESITSHKSPLLTARKFFDRECYDKALAELRQLRSVVGNSLDTIEKIQMFQLFAKCFCELGEYKQALLKIKVAIRLTGRVEDCSLYADVKLDHGIILSRMGRLKDAEQEFLESYAFYKRTNDHRAMLYPLNCIAQMHFVAGNLTRSSDVLELCVKYASMYHSQKDVDIDKRNLARVLVRLGRLERAESVLESIGVMNSDRWGRADYERLRGYARLYRLDLDSAVRHLRSASSIFAELGTKRDIDICHEYLGLLEYYRGNYRKAREYYHKVFDMPEPTASAVAQTLRMLTDVYIAEGKLKKAASTAKKAEDAINKIGERIELGALYRAYGQIYTQKGETETARDYFRKSIDLLKEIGARYELALSYFTRGRSESYSRDERTSFLYTARTLFDEMDVPKRVEQVDDTILDLKSSAIPNIIRSKSNDGLPVIIAVNREMKRIIAYAEEVAGSELSVLLTGETGTGKDLLARYIHRKNGRTGRFVTVNAAAIPNEMIESELFGHKKGAFTGAIEDKPGRFELADNGTFYLNEIGDATPEFQAKLLEVLEVGQVWRLGESRARKVSFRLIAATNHDLAHLMSASLFRLDLYHRLNEVPIAMPTLTDRSDDIPYLVRHFLTDSRHDIKTDGGNAETVERLTAILTLRKYPGNVRELKSRVNELLIAAGGNLSKMVDLALDETLPSEKEQLEAVLKYTDWNRSRAAWILGVSEGTVRNRMKKHGVSGS